MISVQGTFVPTLVSSVFGRTGDVVAESGDYTPEQVGAAAKEHAEKLATGGTDPITPESIGAANKAQSFLITMSASSWSSNTYTISNEAITQSASGDVKISQAATDEEFDAWMDSMMRVTAQSAGSITITARGDVPTIDIPVLLEVRT